MIQVTFIVEDINEIIDVYEHFSKIKGVVVVRVQNSLKAPLKSITLNFIWQDRIIGEVQIREESVSYEANQFLNELANCNNVLQFKQRVGVEIN